jgi:hypothetical protein
VGSGGTETIGAMRVFDSNILIYHRNDALPPSVFTQVTSWIAEGAVISVMSRIEVLGYPQTADQLQQAMRLLAYCEEILLHRHSEAFRGRMYACICPRSCRSSTVPWHRRRVHICQLIGWGATYPPSWAVFTRTRSRF